MAMKIIIGKHPNQDFQILDDEGRDITNLLTVESLELKVSSYTPNTLVKMTVYAEVEVDVDDTFRVTGINDKGTLLETKEIESL